MRKVMCFLMLVLVAGCTHNKTVMDDGKVFQQTGTSSLGQIEGDKLQAAYPGLGATLLNQDGEGNYLIEPGPVAVLSGPMPGGGIGFMVSPRDWIIKGVVYSFNPTTNEITLSVEELSANLSEPLGQHVLALEVALPILQLMTKEEALASIEKWRIIGAVTESVAAKLLEAVLAW